MARKKIVFLLVEGPSDDEALNAIFTRILSNNTVYVHIYFGDITTEKHSTASNIATKIHRIIADYCSNNHFTQKHFQEIIHITDTDGCFIPDTNVKRIPKRETLYTPSAIETYNPALLIARNRQKSSILKKLSTTPTIWDVPYHIYFMSSNLDHVLYNKQNSNETEKEQNSLLFAKKYKNNITDFLSFMNNSDFSVQGNYTNSWQYIRYGLNSLQRHSNLGLCFKNTILSPQ